MNGPRPQKKGNMRRLQVAREGALPSIGISAIYEPQHTEISLKSWETKALRVEIGTTTYTAGMTVYPVLY